MTNPNSHLIFPWGRDGTVEFDLPQGWTLKALLEPSQPQNLPALDQEIDRAMKNPIGSPPLHEFAKQTKTACVVVDDRTRPTPVAAIMPRVIQELNDAGVRDEDITVLMAVGTHRKMTDEEISEQVGPDMVKRLKVLNHDCFNKSQNVSVGKTPTHGVAISFNRIVVEADTIVTVGCIEAHEIAGFGGGYKNLMPGCAGPEAIYATHNAKFVKPERISHSGIPRGRSRFRVMIDECGALLGPKVFIINTVLDPVNVIKIVAGHPLEAHAEGRKVLRAMASVELDEPADVVIANARPLDVDLRTSMKACFNASAALKPGGLFISMSAAPDALGDLRLPKGMPGGAKGFIKKVPIKLIEPIAKRVNKSPDQAVGTISLLTILKTTEAWLYYTPVTEGIDALRAMGIEFFDDMDALLERAKQIRPEAEVVALPQAGASFIAWD